jgi:hypothetical protein
MRVILFWAGGAQAADGGIDGCRASRGMGHSAYLGVACCENRITTQEQLQQAVESTVWLSQEWPNLSGARSEALVYRAARART